MLSLTNRLKANKAIAITFATLSLFAAACGNDDNDSKKKSGGPLNRPERPVDPNTDTSHLRKSETLDLIAIFSANSNLGISVINSQGSDILNQKGSIIKVEISHEIIAYQTVSFTNNIPTYEFFAYQKDGNKLPLERSSQLGDVFKVSDQLIAYSDFSTSELTVHKLDGSVLFGPVKLYSEYTFDLSNHLVTFVDQFQNLNIVNLEGKTVLSGQTVSLHSGTPLYSLHGKLVSADLTSNQSVIYNDQGQPVLGPIDITQDTGIIASNLYIASAKLNGNGVDAILFDHSGKKIRDLSLPSTNARIFGDFLAFADSSNQWTVQNINGEEIVPATPVFISQDFNAISLTHSLYAYLNPSFELVVYNLQEKKEVLSARTIEINSYNLPRFEMSNQAFWYKDVKDNNIVILNSYGKVLRSIFDPTFVEDLQNSSSSSHNKLNVKISRSNLD